MGWKGGRGTGLQMGWKIGRGTGLEMGWKGGRGTGLEMGWKGGRGTRHKIKIQKEAFGGTGAVFAKTDQI